VLFSSAKVIPKVNLIIVGFLLSHSPHELFLISGIYTFYRYFNSPFSGHIFAPLSVKATNTSYMGCWKQICVAQINSGRGTGEKNDHTSVKIKPKYRQRLTTMMSLGTPLYIILYQFQPTHYSNCKNQMVVLANYLAITVA